MRAHAGRAGGGGAVRINNWSDEEGFPGDFALQEANRRRSLQSRAGRKALKRLERALLAMEEKKLYADVLVDPNGEVCAIGAVMVQEKMDEGRVARGSRGVLVRALRGGGHGRLRRGARIPEECAARSHLVERRAARQVPRKGGTGRCLK